MSETAGNGEANKKPDLHENVLNNSGNGEVDKKPDPHEDVSETAANGEVNKEPSPSADMLRNTWIGKVDKKPSPYEHVLKNICENCKLLDHILWRNVKLVESRFESRFRSYRKDNSACFLHCKSYLSGYHNVCLTSQFTQCKPQFLLT